MLESHAYRVERTFKDGVMISEIWHKLPERYVIIEEKDYCLDVESLMLSTSQESILIEKICSEPRVALTKAHLKDLAKSIHTGALDPVKTKEFIDRLFLDDEDVKPS